MSSVLGNGKIRKDQTDHYGRIKQDASEAFDGLAKNPVISVGVNSGNDPVISLEYSKYDKEEQEVVEVSSAVSFDKDEFDLQNNHIHLKTATQSTLGGVKSSPTCGVEEDGSLKPKLVKLYDVSNEELPSVESENVISIPVDNYDLIFITVSFSSGSGSNFCKTITVKPNISYTGSEEIWAEVRGITYADIKYRLIAITSNSIVETTSASDTNHVRIRTIEAH